MPEKRLKLIVINAMIVAMTTLCLAVPHVAIAVEDPVPSQIKNIPMGASMAIVKEMINGSGETATGVSADKRGPEVVWTLAESPHYQTIDFDFTEKDHLYIIRYHMKEGPREEYQGVKKAFFDLYKFQWEEPMRLKIRGNDALLYIIPDNNVTYLFEITDKKTGSKSIEIFDRRISAQDRPPKKQEATPQGSGSKTETAPTPEKGNEPEPKVKDLPSDAK